MIRLAATLLFALLVTGCSIFGDDDEPIDPPAELQDFDASLRVQIRTDIAALQQAATEREMTFLDGDLYALTQGEDEQISIEFIPS